MKNLYQLLNTITAAGSLVNSVFYLLFPVFSLSLLGQSTDPIGLMNTRVAAACALGLCVINWNSRKVIEIDFQRIIAGGNLVMFSVLVLVELQATLGGVLNWFGWLFILADGCLALGYAVFLIRSYR